MTEPVDVSAEPRGSVSGAGRYRLSLTGPASHVLDRQLGRGNLVIGPARLGKGADLRVQEDDTIHWPAFDPFSTPAGSPWPRIIDYYGNDQGFIDWSRNGREIEQFLWAPAFADHRAIDASGANIHRLSLRLDEVAGHLALTVPQVNDLGLSGDLSRVNVMGTLPDGLSLAPTLGRRPDQSPYVLPDLGVLHGVTSLSLHSEPLRQAISLNEIDRYPSLTSLSLRGSFTDWQALARLPKLENLEIRYVPDLDGLPDLSAWPLLDRFIAFNVDETAGKRLKAQMQARGKLRAWTQHASVSQLRKPQWWEREYGRPFSAWAARAAKSANAAYDVAQAALIEAEDIHAVQSAITAFARHFNGMKNIETTEREDIGVAVWQFSQLGQMAKLGVTEAQAMRWFDDVRDY